MAVLIEGMEMPTDGVYWCEIGVAGDIATITIHGEDRKSFPLVPVPPHGRLGDLDALMGRIEHDTPLSSTFEKIVRRYIENAPTVIPASEEG